MGAVGNWRAPNDKTAKRQADGTAHGTKYPVGGGSPLGTGQVPVNVPSAGGRHQEGISAFTKFANERRER